MRAAGGNARECQWSGGKLTFGLSKVQGPPAAPEGREAWSCPWLHHSHASPAAVPEQDPPSPAAADQPCARPVAGHCPPGPARHSSTPQGCLPLGPGQGRPRGAGSWDRAELRTETVAAAVGRSVDTLLLPRPTQPDPAPGKDTGRSSSLFKPETWPSRGFIFTSRPVGEGGSSGDALAQQRKLVTSFEAQRRLLTRACATAANHYTRQTARRTDCLD